MVLLARADRVALHGELLGDAGPTALAAGRPLWRTRAVAAPPVRHDVDLPPARKMPVARDSDRRRERRPVAREDEEMSHHVEPPFTSTARVATSAGCSAGTISSPRPPATGNTSDWCDRP